MIDGNENNVNVGTKQQQFFGGIKRIRATDKIKRIQSEMTNNYGLNDLNLVDFVTITYRIIKNY